MTELSLCTLHAGGRELHARLPPGRSEQKGRPEKDLPFDPDQ